MGRYASDTGGGSYANAPIGTHLARCVKIIDLGTQNGEYMGKPTKRNQVLIMWELPDETTEFDGVPRPITTSRFYTNSLSEKANLRHDLESWRGRSFSEAELDKFDLETILGVPCLLTIVGGENGRTKVATVTGLTKGMQCPPQVNKSFTFWLDTPTLDEAKFNQLSDGIKRIVERSEEYQFFVTGKKPGGNGHAPEPDPDDIPF